MRVLEIGFITMVIGAFVGIGCFALLFLMDIDAVSAVEYYVYGGGIFLLVLGVLIITTCDVKECDLDNLARKAPRAWYGMR